MQAERRLSFATIEEEYNSRQQQQCYIRGLQEWEMRKYTASGHTSRTEYQSRDDMLKDITANFDELQAAAKDQESEVANEPPTPDNERVWNLVTFPLVHCTVHVDILMCVASLTASTKSQREIEISQDPTTIARARKHLTQLLTELKTKLDPITGKVHPSFRFFPERILSDPDLMDWILSEYPLHWPSHMAKLLKDPNTPVYRYVAYLLILQGKPFRDNLQRKHAPTVKSEVLAKAEMARRNLNDQAIDKSRLTDGAVGPKSWVGLDEGEPILATGLYGGTYSAYNDENYYWYYLDHTTTRMIADTHRRMVGSKVSDPIMKQPLAKYSKLLTNEEDRQNLRYWIPLSEDVETFPIKVEAGVQIDRSVEFMNALIAPDVTLGPLDDILDFWNDEESQRGVPQPVNSPLWNETLSTVGQSWQSTACPTCETTCAEACLGVKNVASIPKNFETVFKKLLLPLGTDQELAQWQTATTSVSPTVSYGICTFLADSTSVSDWELDRELTFLGLETWQARLEEDERTPQLATSISIDEYDTRHGEADLGSYPQMEYDLPVSVTIVYKRGRAVVDLQAKPSKAFRPCLIPKLQRPVLASLNAEVNFESGFISKGAINTLTQKDNLVSYPITTSKCGRKYTLSKDPKVPWKKPQIMDVNMISASFTQSDTSSCYHFNACKQCRPCHCALYLTLHPEKQTMLVVWEYADIEVLGGMPPGLIIVPYILSADMALLYLVTHGPTPPTYEKLAGLQATTCTLEKAFMKIIGLAPSLQGKVRKTMSQSLSRAHILREVYCAVNAFKARYLQTFDNMRLRIPIRVLDRLARVHFDPETMTVRPHVHEEDPYLTMDAVLHQHVLNQAIKRRVPRYVHQACRRGTKVKDCPLLPETSAPGVQSHKAEATVSWYMSTLEFIKETYPGRDPKVKPLRQRDIPAYRAAVVKESFEVIPILDFPKDTSIVLSTQEEAAIESITSSENEEGQQPADNTLVAPQELETSQNDPSPSAPLLNLNDELFGLF